VRPGAIIRRRLVVLSSVFAASFLDAAHAASHEREQTSNDAGDELSHAGVRHRLRRARLLALVWGKIKRVDIRRSANNPLSVVCFGFGICSSDRYIV